MIIDSLQHSAQPSPGKSFHMRPGTADSRMAGATPVWETVRGPRQQVEQALSEAAHARPGPGPAPTNQALAYRFTPPGGGGAFPGSAEPFGFGDLIDMINPLHHIPVIGHIYRSLSGDTIKPIARIIGGGVFGGPLGAASGVLNTIIEYETGRDLSGNMMAFVREGEKPQFRSTANNPEQQLDHAARQHNTLAELPGTALRFADLRTDAGAPEPAPRPVNKYGHQWANLND